MTNEHMLPLKLSFLALTFTIFFGSLLALPTDYSKCSHLLSCGSFHNIGYPFWGFNHLRPSYCGLPDFKLECPESNDYPTLHFDEDEYQLVKMMPNYSITLKLQQNAPSNNNCLFHVLGNVLDDALSDHTPTDQIIISLFKCQKPIHSDKDAYYPCPHNSGVTYYRPLPLSVNESNYQFCTFIQITASRKELKPVLEDEAAKRMLGDGFEMDFPDYNHINCKACENSGGICVSGEDFQSFLCYCMDKNKTYAHVCPNSASAAAGLVMTMVLLLLVLIRGRQTRKLGIFWKGRSMENKDVERFLKIYGSLTPKRYTYTTIKKMTNSFKDKLGAGGYAFVYKGKLSDGRFVAVKLLKGLKENGQDFINEVASIGRTNHVNIVKLLGFCYEGNKRALIYEFLPNGSLEKYTFRQGNNDSLPWERIFNIAQGIARGLDYLHRGCNERILHFDIKPHNILLDENFCPKISDFGLSRLCPEQESSISMLEARGTIGYIAPEVFCRNFGTVSHKSDVYSYGMMVLDLVCGRTNTRENADRSSEMYFPEWIYKRLELEEDIAIDKILNDEEKGLQRKMILISLWCIQTYPSSRPSMSKVLELLSGGLESIPIPQKPKLSSPPRLLSIQSSETTSSG